MPEQPCPVCRPGDPCALHRGASTRTEQTTVAFAAEQLVSAIHASGALGLAKLLEQTPKQLSAFLRTSLPEAIVDYLGELPTEALDTSMQTVLRKPQWNKADLQKLCGLLLTRLVIEEMGE